MPKARVLIIEDSFIVAYHLQATLENEGYVVVGKCDSGEGAIKFMEENRPDLVLMDIMLSGKMDGIETASVARSRFNVPVIYITALTDKATVGRAKITEPYGYVTKPFEDREIFTVIEMALYKHDIESRLRQSEEKYFTTVNCISDAVIAIDRSYTISYMNPSAIALTQWSLEDAFGKSIMEVFELRNEVTQEVSINPIQCMMGMGNINRMPDDLILVGRQGLEVPIGESSLSPLLDNKGDFVGLIIVFKNMMEKQEHELLKMEVERQRIAALIEGQELERARIAKDLHDGLGQILNAIKMNVSASLKNGDNIGVLSKLLDEAIQESVRISENLLPSKLRDFDLSVCLRSLCMSIEKTMGITIIFDADSKRYPINQSQKVNFYRIVQEAIHNSVKHGEATVIQVSLTYEHQNVKISIEDNGKGLMNSSKSSGTKNGINNMRDRAEIMGGRFLIDSDQRQRGTIVTVEVPVEKIVINEKV